MLFSQFCAILDRITNASQKADKVRLLEQLWISLRKASSTPTAGPAEIDSGPTAPHKQQHGAKKEQHMIHDPSLHSESDQLQQKMPQLAAGPPTTSATVGDVFFAYMRLLMPQLDTIRSTYALKESKIAKMYVELLGLPHTSPDAIRFLHWKDPSKNHIQATAFSDVVFVVLGKRGHTGASGIASGATNAGVVDAAGRDQHHVSGREASSSSQNHPQGLSVNDVNQCLDRLCAAVAPNDKKGILMHLLRRCSPLEHKWLIRIIVKDMRMHMMHQSILAAFHPNAMELYNNTNDLAYVCKKCTEVAELEVSGDRKQGIFLFQPLKPMLASIVTSAKLATLLRTESLLIEPKYDGERMMIHASCDGKIQYWTRNAKNYTALYGPKFNETIMEAVFRRRGGTSMVSVSNIILDGEFLLYDSVAKEYKEFGSNRAFALGNVGGDVGGGGGGAHYGGHGGGGGGFGAYMSPGKAGGPLILTRNDDEGLRGDDDEDGDNSSAMWFCYQVFDIVFLNGESLLQLPLEKRKSMLPTIVAPQSTKIEIAPWVSPVRTVAEVLHQLDKALTGNHEGIMIKVSASHYIPGERRTKWLKLKPDHVSGLADTLDLVILGGYYGTKYGLRHISHFLLGVWRNESSPTPTSPGAKFMTFCKVGTGYSEQELRELQAQLDSKWIPLPHGTVPEWLDGWKPGAGEVPDVYISPGDSLVLEIFGYSFTATTKFSFGQTLRFPRCHRIRSDKSVADATDLFQLIQIIHSSKDNFAQKLAALQTTGGDPSVDATLLMVQAVKRARKEEIKKEQMASTVLSRTIACIPSTIAVPTRQSVQPESSFLEGYEVCVLFSNPMLHPKQTLERRVMANGGVVVANPQPKTSLIVASSSTNQKVQNWVDMCKKRPEDMQSKYFSTSVIHVDWLLECLQARQVLPLAPRHMIYTSGQLQDLFQRTLDDYQDSFYDPCTKETLMDSIKIVQRKALEQPTPSPATEVVNKTVESRSSDAPHRTTSQRALVPDATQLVALCAASKSLQERKRSVLRVLAAELEEHPCLNTDASGIVPTCQALLEATVGRTLGPVEGVFIAAKSEDEQTNNNSHCDQSALPATLERTSTDIDMSCLFSHVAPQIPLSWRQEGGSPVQQHDVDGVYGVIPSGIRFKRPREELPLGFPFHNEENRCTDGFAIHSRAQFLMVVEQLCRGRLVADVPQTLPVQGTKFKLSKHMWGIDEHGTVAKML